MSLLGTTVGFLLGVLYYAQTSSAPFCSWSGSCTPTAADFYLSPATSSSRPHLRSFKLPSLASDVPPRAPPLQPAFKSPHRVLCFVPTKESAGEAVDLVFTTWGPACDKLLFTSATENPVRNVVKLDLPSLASGGLWNIVHPGWRYLLENHLDEFEWFVKVDDDSYFNADNFKYLVRSSDPDTAQYLGHTQHHTWPLLFNLGAGHAISRGALRQLGPHLPPASASEDRPGFTCSRRHTWAEDVEFAHCLALAGISSANSRDGLLRETFVAFTPKDALQTVRRPDSTSWFWSHKPMGLGSGASCCATHPVLFHGLKVSQRQSGQMRWIHYLLSQVDVDPWP